MQVKKTWIIMSRDRRNANRLDSWNYFKEMNISKQQTIHEMRRQVEKDKQGREWSVFEMIAGFGSKVEVVEAQIVEPDELPAAAIVEGDDGLGQPVRADGAFDFDQIARAGQFNVELGNFDGDAENDLEE